MTETIQLVRNDQSPWGFRLTGGRDFSTPLNIIRITGGSIAERAGLRVGDIVIKINGEETKDLTHNDAQRCIIKASNSLVFDIRRGHPVPPPLTPIRGMVPGTGLEIKRQRSISTVSIGSFDSTYEDVSLELIDINGSIKEERGCEVTEEEIAEMLLENAEVIEEKGKNVIGVNFRRFIPKCDFIKDSAVFHVLQEEQVHKELSEKEQLKKWPNKRFSTFLELPDRPIPEPKPKSKPADKKQEETIDRNNENEETHNKIELDINDASTEKKIDNIEETDNMENSTEDSLDEIGTVEIEDITTSYECYTEEDSQEEFIFINKVTENKQKNNELPQSENYTKAIDEEKGEEQSEFDLQLAEIKAKLDSLQQLPTIIETHLTEVQTQISRLMQLKKSQVEGKSEETELDDVISEVNVETCSIHEESTENIGQVDVIEEESLEIDSQTDIEEIEGENEVKENENQLTDTENVNQLPIQDNVKQKRKERPACPLTPLPRPVVLPGGRRWRRPKDAYNEKFIAETLISQAEVLVGSTLGVNFRKYESPKFDLSNSAVYKLIHNLESPQGIENRPEKVPAEQEYYQSPISARHFYCATLDLNSDENTNNCTVEI